MSPQSSTREKDLATATTESAVTSLRFDCDEEYEHWQSDLVGTGFMMVAFVFLPASILQMTRGATIVFTAIFSVVILGRKMQCFNWLGVATCTFGILMLGASTVLASKPAENGSANEQGAAMVVFGLAMNFAGCVFASLQIITEEKLLKDVKLPPMLIVGFEGVWGTILMLLVGFPLVHNLPGSDSGSVENVFDTVEMWRNNPTLLWLILLYIFSCSTYNMAGMMVTGSLSAVHRMMLEASRTLFVWMINLVIHYKINPSSGMGETWTPYSFLQLAGFMVVILGQMIYGGILKVPGLRYEDAPLPTPTPSPGGMYTNAMVSLPDDDEHDTKEACKL